MKIFNSKIILLLLCLFASTVVAAPECKSRKDIVDACFTVKGALRLYDGTPSARILVTGTKRILAVKPFYESDNETFIAPDWIRAKADFYKPVRGTFLVCPLTTEKPHQMQEICIESGNLK